MNITASERPTGPRIARSGEELKFHVKHARRSAGIPLISRRRPFHVKHLVSTPAGVARPDPHADAAVGIRGPRDERRHGPRDPSGELGAPSASTAPPGAKPSDDSLRATRAARSPQPYSEVYLTAPPFAHPLTRCDRHAWTTPQGRIINAIHARRRLALFSLFLVPGFAISSWVTRTPAIRDLLGASASEMGLVLLGLSAGSMVGIVVSGPAVARFGARQVMVAGTLGVILSMPTIGAGAGAGSAALTAFGLFLFGIGMGGGEIAMNVEGADIEKAIQRPVLPALHGFFSLGTVLGASLGILFTAVDVPVVWHLISIGVITLVVLVVAARWIPGGTGRVDPLAGAGRRSAVGSPLWKDSRLLLIAAIVLAMALAEGTAGDWLPLVMVDGHGFGPASGSAVYAIFAASMTVGRFTGGAFIARFGRAPVLRVSIIAGAVGMALVIFVDSQQVAAAAVVLWAWAPPWASRWHCPRPESLAKTPPDACLSPRPSATSPSSSVHRSSVSSASTTGSGRPSSSRWSWSLHRP